MPSTRERLLQHLKRWPGAHLDALSQCLGLAPMTIRQHLANLTVVGLVRTESERGPTGRAAYAYYLTAEPGDRFPKSYDRLDRLLLEAPTLIDPQQLLGVTPDRRRKTLFEAAARRATAPHLPALQPSPVAAASAPQSPGSARSADSPSSAKEISRKATNSTASIAAYVGHLLGTEVALAGSQCDGDACCRLRPVNDPGPPPAAVPTDT